MPNIGDVDTTLRSENEISAAAVREFYGTYAYFFDEAINAIVTGCVSEYSFDDKEKKFVGIVTSFDGSKSYEVKVYVTDDFTIQSTFCECGERVCSHVGALALHSGFNTPIFSYLPESGTTTSPHGDTVKNPVDEVCSSTEIEFIKVEQTKDDQGKGATLDDEEHVSIERICGNGSNYKINILPDNSLIENKIKEQERITFPVERNWKKSRRLILTSDEWFNVFDSQRNHCNLNSMHIFTAKLNSQYGNSLCALQLDHKYPIYPTFRFECISKDCSRKYRLTLLQRYADSECYEFDVYYIGEIEHRP